MGSNPNPTVKVACGKHIQQTSTQKGTNNPAFDEVSKINSTKNTNTGSLYEVIVHLVITIYHSAHHNS